jgi:hypothetical protein
MLMVASIPYSSSVRTNVASENRGGDNGCSGTNQTLSLILSKPAGLVSSSGLT